MRKIRHVNMKDSMGRVYCCLRNKVVELHDEQTAEFCRSCSMYAGDAGGKGVECLWEDMRPVKDPHLAEDPQKEWESNQKKKIWPTGHLIE